MPNADHTFQPIQLVSSVKVAQPFYFGSRTGERQLFEGQRMVVSPVFFEFLQKRTAGNSNLSANWKVSIV